MSPPILFDVPHLPCANSSFRNRKSELESILGDKKDSGLQGCRMYLNGTFLMNSLYLLRYLPDHNPNRYAVNDVLCVDFEPASLTEKRLQTTLIENELKRRDIRPHPYRSQNKASLKERMKAEWAYHSICPRVDYCDKRKGLTLYESWQGATCTLHLEARVGEKILQCILRRGLGHAEKVYAGAPTFKQAQQLLVNDVGQVIRGQVFNTTRRDGFWRFPVEQSKDGSGGLELGKISFTKGRARKVIEHIDLILILCYADDEQKMEQLSCAINSYRSAVEILRKKSNYTEEEVVQYQEHVNDWYRVWIKEFGIVGCTNYTHLLGSGHIAEEMRLFGCLYRYSQEGLEAVNALIKSYFFRRTSRGGGTGVGTWNRLEPVGRWLQRKMYFLLDMGADRQSVVAESEEDDRSDESEEEESDDDCTVYDNM